jgi:glycerol-1-phosphatase
LIEGFLFDVDGVLVHGSDAIPGAVEALRGLVAAHFKVGYITNENPMTRQACAIKLGQSGNRRYSDDCVPIAAQ